VHQHIFGIFWWHLWYLLGMDGRRRLLLLLLPFIIGTPSSLALTFRWTNLDRAVYLTIYININIRWRVHDPRVDTRGLVPYGDGYHLSFYRGCHIYELFALGRKFLLSDCSGAVVQEFKILDIVCAVMEICMCV